MNFDIHLNLSELQIAPSKQTVACAIVSISGLVFAILASQYWGDYKQFISTHQYVLLGEAAIISLTAFAVLKRDDVDRTLKQKMGMVVVTLCAIAAISYALSAAHKLDIFQTSWHKYTKGFHSHPIFGIFSVSVPLLTFNLFLGLFYYSFRHDKKDETISGYAHYLTLPVSTYVTEGLAKIFDFEVLRHGTHFKAYNGILHEGADPNKGGSGSTAVMSAEYERRKKEVEYGGKTQMHTTYIKGQDECRNKFHVFKDSDALLVTKKLPDADGFLQLDMNSAVPFVGHIGKRTAPRLFAVVSGVSRGQTLPAKVALGMINFFSPAIRYIYRPDEIQNTFENDPDFSNLAWRTTQKLPNHRIGLVGVLGQASFNDFRRAVTKNPIRVLGGVVQLAAGVALTALGVGTIL